MDSLVTYYLGKLHEDVDNESNALSIVNLLNDVLNTELDKKDLNLELLFKDSTGIIPYLKKLSRKRDVEKELIKELFNLLKFVATDLKDSASKYIQLLVENFCDHAIMHAECAEFRNSTFDLLLVLIRTPGIIYFQSNREWLSKFYTKLMHDKIEKSSSSTEKKKACELLGEILNCAPELTDTTKRNQIFRQLCREISHQLKFQKADSASFRVIELEGLYNCLELFLRKFHEEKLVKESADLYSFVKDGCGMEIQHRKTANRAAFKILEKHIDLFSDNVFKDFTWWTKLLDKYLMSSNKEDQLAAFHVMNSFYRGIAKILKKKSGEHETLKYFMELLRKKMTKNSNYEVALAVENFGHFAKVCRLYNEEEELRRMFALTSQMAENYCAGQIENIELHHMSGLLVSMARIAKNMYEKNLNENEFTIIEKLSVFIVVSYPKVPNHFRYLVKNNLIKTIITVGNINDVFMNSYLEKFILPSLIKCCSCPLKRDIEYLNSLGNIENSDLISCNDYVALWKAICNIECELTEHKIVSDRKKIDTITVKNLPSKVFNVFVESILDIFKKLDFSVIEDDFNNNDESGIIDDCGFKPKIESDFYIFVNLVELFSVVVDSCTVNIFEKWIPTLIKEIVKLSASCAIKSGFFQLLSIIFQKECSEDFDFYEPSFLELKSFLISTLVNLQNLKGVNLNSCLRMVLKIPRCFVKVITPYIVPIFQVILAQGLEDLSLARTALKSLVSWKTRVEPNKYELILKEVVPLLNPYLQSKKSVGDTETLTKYEERLILPVITQPKNKIYKKFLKPQNNSSNVELLQFQKEILTFLGDIDVNLCRPIYNPEKQSTNEFTEVLRFEVPFRDEKVKIFLDKFLPRIVELATHGTLKTRIAACEVLHSMTLVFLGNTILGYGFQQNLSKPVENLFKELMQCVFKLGCDNNVVIKVMFSQLSRQLVRYYSRQYQNKVTTLILEILFDSVSHPHDVSLRHFSAPLIREFVRGSLQNHENDSSFSNILVVIKYIGLYSQQPCTFKRQGAALAFNEIYRDLRENRDLVNIYWIELLVCFVKSLSLESENEYDNCGISDALGHIKRVILEKVDLFIKSTASRRVPKCLQDGTIKSVIAWMLRYCIADQRSCREQSSCLIVDICAKVPGVGTLKIFFDGCKNDELALCKEIFSHISVDEALLNYEDILWHDGDEFYHLEFSKKMVKWLKNMLSGLNCLSWLLKEENAECRSSLSDDRFLKSMKFFCGVILPKTLEVYMTEKLPHVKYELIPLHLGSTYESLKSEIFSEYLTILGLTETSYFITFLGNEEWQKNFWETCVSYLFAPSTFIMNASSHKRTATVITKVLSRLGEMPINLQEIIYSKIRNNDVHDLFDTFIDDLENRQIISSIERRYINALYMLQESGIIAQTLQNVAGKKSKIIDNLFNYVESNGKVKSSNPAITIQLEPLLGFALIDCDVTYVVELLANSRMLSVDNSVALSISHGRHFFNTFKKPLVQYLCHHQKRVVDGFLLPSMLTKEKLLIVKDFVKFGGESSKSADLKETVEAIFQNWSSLVCWNFGDDSSLLLFSLIDAVVTHHESLMELTEELKYPVFLWLINNLLDKKNFLTCRKEYFKLLTPFISSANELKRSTLRNKLEEFRGKYFDVSSADKLTEPECVTVFKALLTLFLESENIIVYEIIVSIGASDIGDGSEVSIQQTLEAIMKKLSVESQLEFLNSTFHLFKDQRKTAKFRLNCAKKFLVPLIYTSKVESLKMFFSVAMQYVVEVLEKPITNIHSTGLDEKNNIFLKTGAVSIAEVYSDLECEEIKQFVTTKGSEEKKTANSAICRLFFDSVGRQETLIDNDNRSALRVLKCYYYNTLIKVTQKVPKGINVYASLFREDPNRQRLIWASIIDSNEEFNLKMFIDDIPARCKALKQKRKELKSRSVSGTSMQSIPTQYLSTSSLVSNVKYDMSEWNISNEGYIVQAENKSYNVDLEEDKLNNHECMNTICELIMSIVENNISPLPDLELNPVPEPPLWMENLRSSLKYALRYRHRNIVLYFLKMIHNCEKVFCPYAKSWIDLIIECVLMLDDINYLTADNITMILSWRDVYIPINKSKNNSLVALILRNISSEVTNVRKYRIQLLITVIKLWYEHIDVPDISPIYSKEISPNMLEVNLEMTKAFLSKKILPFNADDAVVNKYSNVLLLHTDRNFARGIKLLIFEVLALLLKVIKTTNISEKCCNDLRKSLVVKLNLLVVDNTKTKTDLFLSCLEHTLTYYPAILHSFLAYLVGHFAKFQGSIKVKCLRMINVDTEELPKETFSELMSMQFANCLRESNNDIVKYALMTLKKCIQTVTAEEMETMLPDIVRLSSHATSECRQLVYEIADSFYTICLNNPNANFERIQAQCRVILLNGLLDKDKTLQEKIFTSWKVRCNLSDVVVDRFISIIENMYSPQNESRFVNYATDFLLDACFSTPDFKSKIFDNPLSNCEFREQDFRPLTMLKNKHSIAPMFMNSLSNQLVELSLSNSKTCTLVLPGSQRKLYFQPSQDAQVSEYSQTSDFRQWTTSVKSTLKDYSLRDDPDIRKLKKRLQSSSTEASRFYAQKNIEKREKRLEILERKSERAEKDIQFSRTYRDGDIPDIEIPRSAVINPLKILAKKDAVIARLVFISIFDGMCLDHPNKKRNLEAISRGFNKILNSSIQFDSLLIETIFETVFFHPSEFQLDSQKVVVASYSGDLLSLGSLILENSLLSEDLSTNTSYAAKRLKVDDLSYRDKWVQLAELYKALDKNDIVNGILKEKIEGRAAETLKTGLEFEKKLDWENAGRVYEEKINQYLQGNTKSFEENFIFDTYLKCAANLSKWENISTMIKRKFGDLNNLWQDSWDVEHTLPWFFTAEAIICAKENRPSNELKIVKKWMQDEEKKLQLNNLIAEPISILLFLSCENFEAKDKVNRSIESMLQNWSYSTSSLNSFYKLLTLSEINNMLHPYLVSDSTLSAKACQSVYNSWSSSKPRNDDLYWWDKRISYRQRFSYKYMEQLDAAEEGDLCKDLQKYIVDSNLQMVNVALQLQNETLAKNYCIQAYMYKDKYPTAELVLTHSKVLLLIAQKLNSTEHYVHCLEKLKEHSESTTPTYPYHMHLADSLRVLQDKWSSFDNTNKNQMLDYLGHLLEKPGIDNDVVRIEMQEGVIKHFQEAAKAAENSKSHLPCEIAASYLSLAKYCRELWDGCHADEQLRYKENYVRSILRALKFDSKEAQLLFPTLLTLEQITDETLKTVFIAESAAIEEWKFLAWIQQLLAHIDTDILPLIEELLQKIIEKYPNAIQFSFFSSDLVQHNYKNSAAERLSKRLKQILNRNSKITDFVNAIACVRVPDDYFYYYLKKLLKLLRQDDSSQKISDIKEEMENVQNKGKLFTENVWWEKLKTLLSCFENKSKTTKSLDTDIQDYINKYKATRQSKNFESSEYKFLRNYNSWFSNFSEIVDANIEIPGQYDGFRIPDPDRHVKIFEFNDRNVQVQISVQAPIKIELMGDDAKKYSYLIKFGEDTRQDQRIQQIFSIMNRCSATEAEKNGDDDILSVTTYGVFPLTPYFGVIEWLDRTTSLRDFMDYKLPENKKKESKQYRDKILNEYSSAIAYYCPGRRETAYEEAVKNFSISRILTTFENLSNKISLDVFKKSILALCNSPAMYWNLRNQFMISYSTLCMYGWILGIGDRHLSNFLVCLKTGRCVGIDFGHAFGTGTTYLQIPELIPFRMTPHIVSIMAPFSLTGLIRETMTNTLKIILQNEYVLFATMQIFILDPSFNWLKSIKKQNLELFGMEETDYDMQWYPIHKMKRIKRKLQGINPVKILQEEVQDNNFITMSYKNACVKLLNRENSFRSTLPVDNISLTEQIDCLLDIATDKCILGTSWAGLECYI